MRHLLGERATTVCRKGRNVSRENNALTLREKGALAITTAATTLALGVTLAALGGRLHAPPAAPSVAAASETTDERVILVPIERASDEQVGAQPATDGQATYERGAQREPRRRHREHERRSRHERHDEDEAFDG